jgi:hypothetical protein
MWGISVRSGMRCGGPCPPMGPIGPMGLIGREDISPVRSRSLGLHAPARSPLLAPSSCIDLLLTSSFPRYADLFGHVDKLNDRFSPHFAHDVSAMDFYGDLAAS